MGPYRARDTMINADARRDLLQRDEGHTVAPSSSSDGAARAPIALNGAPYVFISRSGIMGRRAESPDRRSTATITSALTLSRFKCCHSPGRAADLTPWPLGVPIWRFSPWRAGSFFFLPFLLFLFFHTMHARGKGSYPGNRLAPANRAS